MGMNNEPPRCQECQELSFSIKRENKIIPQICNAGNRNTGLSVEKVTNVILEAMETPKPKRQYFVAESPWQLKLKALYKRLLPHQYFYDTFYFDNLRKALGLD